MTRKSIALPMSIGLLAVLVAAAFFVFGNPARSEAAGGPPKSRDNIVVALVGTGTLLDAADNPDDAPDGALCFTIDMFDPKTKDQVGEATAWPCAGSHPIAIPDRLPRIPRNLPCFSP